MIRVEGVSVFFEEFQALKGVSLHVERGRTKAVVGASGCGKSTLLKVVIGLLKPDAGEVYIDGEALSRLDAERLDRVRRRIAMVFQANALFDSLSVGENVGYRLLERGEMDEAAVEERVRESLRYVGLEEAIDMLPEELSGGMKKRVAFARALASGAEILLFDEPTAGLDPINAKNINQLILGLRDRAGVTSVVVTHDLHCACMVATSLAMLHEGTLLFDGTPDEFLSSKDPLIQQFVEPFLLGGVDRDRVAAERGR
ncbi:MAG: ATP-binding cassette domain-containing protein [Nitrospirae bacterium]|nr:ATP-binding cassette domain-containing protein [Nitrospirota bacterium]